LASLIGKVVGAIGVMIVVGFCALQAVETPQLVIAACCLALLAVAFFDDLDSAREIARLRAASDRS
jgi:hypothetical protein